MKKTKLFGWAFIATMMGTGFSACSNNAEEDLVQETEIRLTSEITPSRAVSGLQSTEIEQGQQVGVTITGAKNEHENVRWDVEEDGSLTNKGDKLYWGDNNVSIYAYHPYNEEWAEGTGTFSVKVDQSSNDGYLNSDLLYAKKTGVANSENDIELMFTHMLSLINITLSNDDISESNKATVYICGTNINLDFDLLGDFPTSESTTPNLQEIKVGEITSNSQTISAIIIPQTIEGNSKFIRINFKEKDYYLRLRYKTSFVSGGKKSFTLNLKDKENLVELKNLTTSINGWTDKLGYESNAGEGDGATEIYVGRAGTLSALINADEMFYHLKLSGKINNDDLSYIKTSLDHLTYLDLSDTSHENSSIDLNNSFDSSNSGLNYLSLPKNTTKITGDAPYYLTTIIIPSNITEISSTFTTELKEIYCKATNPPTLSTNVFPSSISSTCTLYVPTASLTNYQNNESWKIFTTIKGE